jgi:hypothetical protein
LECIDDDLVNSEYYILVREAIPVCKEALEQPAQVPVAWMYNGNLHEFNPSDWATEPVTPLYTHPHQWQGLTDDEIDALEHNDFTCWGRDDLIVFGRAIEQALRNKNT